jgi:hypothetical protein
MKNILKLLSLSIFVVITFSCSNDSADDLKYSAQTESGWIQFMNYSPSEITAFVKEGGEISMDVNIVVPNTSSDLTIYYDLVSVSGDDPNGLFSNSGNIIVPAGETSYMGPNSVQDDADENPIDESGNNTGIDFTYLAEIVLNIDDLSDATLSGPLVFDVVLTGTSSSKITAGLEGETFKVAQRVTIVSVESLAGEYIVSEPVVAASSTPVNYQVELAYNAANPFTLTASNTDGNYFFTGATMTFSNGGITVTDAINNSPGPIVAFADYFVLEADDVLFGSDQSGNTTLTFGTNTGQLFNQGLDYYMVMTKI